MKEKTAAASTIFILSFPIFLLLGNKCASVFFSNKQFQQINVHSRKLSCSEMYAIGLQNKIKANWTPPKDIKNKTNVVVLFKLDRHGNVLSANVLKSSEDMEIDESAIKAIIDSSPFERLPKKLKGKHVDVQFNFDYNPPKNNPKI